MEKKIRLSAYLDPDVMRLLADFADRRHQSRSLVAEAAIASFLSPDTDECGEATTVKRLDRIDRRMQRIERDLGVAIETIAVFAFFWLASTPQMPDSAQTAARSRARERYSRFLEALGRRLANGPTLRQEVGEDIQGH